MTKTALPSTGLRGVEKSAEKTACTNSMAESESRTELREQLTFKEQVTFEHYSHKCANGFGLFHVSAK